MIVGFNKFIICFIVLSTLRHTYILILSPLLSLNKLPTSQSHHVYFSQDLSLPPLLTDCYTDINYGDLTCELLPIQRTMEQFIPFFTNPTISISPHKMVLIFIFSLMRFSFFSSNLRYRGTLLVGSRRWTFGFKKPLH